VTPDLYLLLVVQFLSAFSDYAILFTTIAIVMQDANSPAWYIPALQGLFLTAYVLLAPWVGPFTDQHPKAAVLSYANFIKALGATFLFLGIEPLFAYAIVGIGAAIYSTAKYGILPELLPTERLVTANGWVEGITIGAMLAGSIIGGAIADRSTVLATGLIAVLFISAGIAARWIQAITARAQTDLSAIARFLWLIRGLLKTRQARFCILGVVLFWATTAALRVMLFSWAPLVLSIHDSAGIAALSFSVFIGSATGAAIVPGIIPLEKLRRGRFAAYFFGAVIVLLAITEGIWPARLVLFLIGFTGGVFLIPLNAALQEIGYRSIGSGNTIAVQQFFESLGMAGATMIYGIATGFGANPIASIAVLGLMVILSTLTVSGHLPKKVS